MLNGALDAIDRALAALVRFGDRVVVENPTFRRSSTCSTTTGSNPWASNLDAEGMRPEAFSAALGSSPRDRAHAAARSQPTGISMTPARAEQLAGILDRSRTAQDAVVIEDDHSGAISSSPDVTLATWLPERVLHVRSFSKSHGPDLRIGAIRGRGRWWIAWSRGVSSAPAGPPA